MDDTKTMPVSQLIWTPVDLDPRRFGPPVHIRGGSISAKGGPYLRGFGGQVVSALAFHL